MRPCVTSQRELRGMPKRKMRKSRAGIAATPKLPAPLSGAQVESTDHVIGEVGEQNADDDVDLEHADKSSAPLCGSKFGNIDGAENGRSADSQAADEAEDDERRPTPRKGAAERRDDVEDGGDAQRFAAAKPLADGSGAHSSDHGSPESDGDREAQASPKEAGGGQMEDLRELACCAGNDSGVKAKQQTTEGTHKGALYQIAVERHGSELRR